MSGGYGHRIALALVLSGAPLFVERGGAAFAADDLNVCIASDPMPAEARLESELSGQDIDARLLSLSAGPVLCLDWAGQTARLTPAGIGRSKAQVAVHCMGNGKMPSTQEGVLYFEDVAAGLSAAIFPVSKVEKHKIGLCAIDSERHVIATAKGRRQ